MDGWVGRVKAKAKGKVKAKVEATVEIPYMDERTCHPPCSSPSGGYLSTTSPSWTLDG
jgi:hypothetical protein